MWIFKKVKKRKPRKDTKIWTKVIDKKDKFFCPGYRRTRIFCTLYKILPIAQKFSTDNYFSYKLVLLKTKHEIRKCHGTNHNKDLYSVLHDFLVQLKRKTEV